MRVEEMKIKIEKYSSALGLRFEKQGNLIHFTFTRISASNPERAFQLAMTLDDAGRYKGQLRAIDHFSDRLCVVINSVPCLSILQNLEEDLIKSNDLKTFIVAVRKAFVDLAN